MHKIAVLYCEKLAKECSGYKCLDAFNRRSDAFSVHGGDAALAGFFACNGCQQFDSEEMKLKYSQLEKSGVQDIHLSLCVLKNCHHSQALIASIPKRFNVISGSHT